MDVTDKHMQALIDAEEWQAVAEAYEGARRQSVNEGLDEQAAFQGTHALVFAYLAGDKILVGELETFLKDEGRL